MAEKDGHRLDADQSESQNGLLLAAAVLGHHSQTAEPHPLGHMAHMQQEKIAPCARS